MILMRATASIGVGVIAASALAGCSLRLESAQPTYPSPGPVTLTRDAAATREQDILDAMGDLSATPSASDALLASYEGQAAPIRIAALGGIYVPYPGASPAPTTTPLTTPTVADTVAAARDGALADAQTTSDEDLAFVLASAGLSHAVTAWYADWATQSVDPDTISQERMLTTPAFDDVTVIPTSTQIDPATVSSLALAHDRARYVYEVMAARSGDAERSQWLTRRDIQAQRAADLVALPEVDDTREAIYMLSPEEVANETSRRATAQDIETTLADMYAALMKGSGDDLAWLLGAAFDGYAQAAAYADPTTETATIAPLPAVADAAE